MPRFNPDAEKLMQSELQALRLLLSGENRSVMLIAMMQEGSGEERTAAVVGRTNTACTPRQALMFAAVLENEARAIRELVEKGGE